MDRAIHVRMGEIKISSQPSILKTTGLGSCIALIIYDYTLKTGGMAHIMLPMSTKKDEEVKIGKYANTAIPYLYGELKKNGCSEKNLWAKITGGAQMFSFEGTNSLLRIGERNIEVVKKILKVFKIPINSEDVGGDKGRTIEFDLASGELKIKIFQSGEIII